MRPAAAQAVAIRQSLQPQGVLVYLRTRLSRLAVELINGWWVRGRNSC